MQRNMDLVRTILMRIENSPSGRASPEFGIQGYPADQVRYHSHIMMQEGLIEGLDVTTMHSEGPEAVPTSLTWKGHEFLDLARDQDRWNRVKSIITKVGSAPISVWMKVLGDFLLQSVESAVAATSSRGSCKPSRHTFSTMVSPIAKVGTNI